MTVAVSAFHIDHRVGIGTYLRGLLPAIARADAENRYLVVTRAPGLCPPFGGGFEEIAHPFAGGLYEWEEEVTRFPEVLSRRPDVWLFPHFAAVPPVDGPVVMVIHDLIPLTLARFRWKTGERRHGRKAVAAAKRAARVVCVSRFTAGEVARLCGIRDAVVIENGVDAEGLARPGKRPPSIPPDVGPYVLYVGDFGFRKNVPALVSAFGRLPAALREKHRLVLAGSGSEERRIRRAARGLGERVLFPGTVSSEDLAWLYTNARLFVFPSLFEGFGLPPLEAMACGVPVVASDRSSIPEVVGEAGLLVDPEDPRAMARAMERVLADPALAARLGEEGKKRARQFRWEDAAAKMIDLFRRLA